MVINLMTSFGLFITCALEQHQKQGWESKLRRILQNVNKSRHLGVKNVWLVYNSF
jgi:hypothetical protein